MSTLAEAITALCRAYPPELAESWDAVGLACGDPAQRVERVLVAVDPSAAVVAQAVDYGAQLLLTHHPLLLRGVHGVPADDPKGALIHRLVRAGIALYTAHTNADAASPGVSDALAETLGVRVRGLLGADGQAVTGIGRIGELPAPLTLREFTQHVADRLPATAWGVRAAGDPTRLVRTVALSGGAGDGYLDAATRAGVDVFLTADLRHHPALEHCEREGYPGAVPALVDVAHWASEWPWCEQAAAVLRAAGTVEVRVSGLCTDPWSLRAQPGGGCVAMGDAVTSGG